MSFADASVVSTYVYCCLHLFKHQVPYIFYLGTGKYVCMVIKSMDQPGKVANLACGQLNRENECFPVPVRAWEFGLARQVQPSRPASACSISLLRPNLVLT